MSFIRTHIPKPIPIPIRTAARSAVISLAIILSTAIPEIAHSVGLEGKRTLRFNVWLDEREIGSHLVEIEERPSGTHVHTHVNYNVKVLFVSVFKYNHEAEEHWLGQCLEQLASETKVNRNASTLRGYRTDQAFVIDSSESKSPSAPACLGTYAYWDHQRISRPGLLNAQTGEYSTATLSALGPTALPSPAKPAGTEKAAAFRLQTDQGTIDLWYDANDEWLALQTELDGRTLTYTRVEP